MVQSGNSITITFGNLISGSRNTTGAGTITWKPSALATDLLGHPSSTALVTESGALDLDF
jgi:hypothetical protein